MVDDANQEARVFHTRQNIMHMGPAVGADGACRASRRVSGLTALLRLALLFLALLAAPGGAQAQSAAPGRAAQEAALVAALDIAGTVEIMHEEGLQYGAQIADEMLPEDATGDWSATVARIHSQPRMQRLVVNEMSVALDGVDLAPILDFFEAPPGRRIVALEMEARRAFMDPDIEAAASERAMAARSENRPLVARIDRLIADSDLVPLNVEGALNANLMFLRGLADGGASEMSEDEMLAQVWSQAEQTRAETELWLTAFLMTAYAPLDGAELDRYAEFYRTPEGRALNRAMFAGFNRMYDELSYLLGRAVARQLTSTAL